MRFSMSLWTSCLGRDCLLLDLGQRRNGSNPPGVGRASRCRRSTSGECTGRRALLAYGPERTPAIDGASWGDSHVDRF